MLGLGLDYGLGFSSDIRLRQDPQLRVSHLATTLVDRQTDKWMDGHKKKGWTNRQTNKQINKWTDGLMERQTNGRMDKQTNEQIDGRTNERTNKQTTKFVY